MIGFFINTVVYSDVLSFYYVMRILTIVNIHQSRPLGIHLAKLVLILASAKGTTHLENNWVSQKLELLL